MADSRQAPIRFRNGLIALGLAAVGGFLLWFWLFRTAPAVDPEPAEPDPAAHHGGLGGRRVRGRGGEIGQTGREEVTRVDHEEEKGDDAQDRHSSPEHRAVGRRSKIGQRSGLDG